MPNALRYKVVKQPRKAPTNAAADGLYNNASLERSPNCAFSFGWRFDKMPLRWGKSTRNIIHALQAYKKSKPALFACRRKRSFVKIQRWRPAARSQKDGRSFEKPRVVGLGKKISPIDFLLCRPTYNKRICSGKRGNQLQISGSQPQKSRLRHNRNIAVAMPTFGAELSTSSEIAIVISGLSRVCRHTFGLND
jgi:hypothetical protein